VYTTASRPKEFFVRESKNLFLIERVPHKTGEDQKDFKKKKKRSAEKKGGKNRKKKMGVEGRA